MAFADIDDVNFLMPLPLWWEEAPQLLPFSNDDELLRQPEDDDDDDEEDDEDDGDRSTLGLARPEAVDGDTSMSDIRIR